MPEFINITSIVTSLCIAAITGLIGLSWKHLKQIPTAIETWNETAKNISELNDKVDKIQSDLAIEQDCSLSMLRDRIYQKCRYHLQQGFMGIEDRQILQKMYEQYKNKGGNGSIDITVEQAFELPFEKVA